MTLVRGATNGNDPGRVWKDEGLRPLLVGMGLALLLLALALLGSLQRPLLLSILGVLGVLWLLLLGAYARGERRQALLLQRLEQAQELAVLGTWRWPIDSRTIEWGGQSARIYGFPAGTIVVALDDVMRRVHPDDVDGIARWVEVARSADPQELVGRSLEFRVLRGDGSVRWILCKVEADALGDARTLHGVQQDITAQVIDRERLRMAQQIARIGDWEWDVATGAIRWSPTMYDIYGVDPQTFKPDAESAFARIHDDDRARIQAMGRALAEHGKPCQAEFRILRDDGTVRVLSVRGVRETTPDGSVVIRSVQQDITELAQAREHARRTEEQYRFLFEHNPLPMWVFDRESLTFLAANDAMARHYGHSRDEIVGRSMLDIRPPQDRDAVEAAARLASSERPQGRVWTHLRKDGTRLRAAVYTHDILFDDRPARLVAAQDVTERETSEQRFQLVARATSDAIYDLDLRRDILWWSDSFHALFGYSPEEIAPTLEGWEALVHADDLAVVNASLAAAIADPARSEWEEEYRFRRRDGTYATVVDRGFFVRDEAGVAVRMVGGMLDVTQKRQQDADLRLLRRAVESTDNGIVIADALSPDMPLVYVNAAFEQMTGYASAEVLGRNCRFLQGTEHDQAALQTLRLAIADRREARVVLRNYRKDGSLFWNELHLAPVHAEDGSVAHFVGTQTDVSHRHHYEQELAHRATHDQLTGLPNRQLIMDRLQQAILNADRYGRHVAVLFLDLDDFKLINDNLDHAAGDEALRIVASRLQAAVRDTDTVGRFGGDEFVIVLTDQTDAAGVEQVIERVSTALSVPMPIGSLSHTLSPSIGWCRYPDGGHDADTLLKHADMAMYQAKRQGRNRAIAYEPGFDAQVSQRLHLVAQLREALERDEFELRFQLLFDGEGRPVAMEGLVRWRHPERGLLPPSEFLGVCEESGLIIELGRSVLHKAARHHALLVAAGYPGLRIAVNVSALQFGYALEGDVDAIVREYQLPAGILELEITESVILADPERAIEAMQRIAALGVCLSVDDFGTGYSSLAYLRRLPIHRLKIDRSFVEDLPEDREAASICNSIIGLAHSLQLQTVGEGVETEAQLQWLRAAGCDEVQGYLLARPAPFSEVLARLESGGPATSA